MHAADERETSRAGNGAVEPAHGEVLPPGRAARVGPLEESCQENGGENQERHEEEATRVGGEDVVALGEEGEG